MDLPIAMSPSWGPKNRLGTLVEIIQGNEQHTGGMGIGAIVSHYQGLG